MDSDYKYNEYDVPKSAMPRPHHEFDPKEHDREKFAESEAKNEREKELEVKKEASQYDDKYLAHKKCLSCGQCSDCFPLKTATKSPGVGPSTGQFPDIMSQYQPYGLPQPSYPVQGTYQSLGVQNVPGVYMGSGTSTTNAANTVSALNGSYAGFAGSVGSSKAKVVVSGTAGRGCSDPFCPGCYSRP